MSVEITEPSVLQSLRFLVGHPPPYTAEELKGVNVLRVSHARDLSWARHFPGLWSLDMVGCEVESLEELRAMKSLGRLEVKFSAVCDISALAECPALKTAVLRCNCIEDASPLLSLAAPESVDLTGNPLSEQSFREHVPALRERSQAFAASDEEEWELTRKLHERGLRASLYRDGEVHRLCAPGLAFNEMPEAANPAIPPADLRRELERPDVTLEELFRKYPVVPGGAPAEAEAPAAAPFDYAAHETVGDAGEARRWLKESKLPAAQRDALLRFVDRFPEQQFFRVDDAWLDRAAADEGVPLPAWLRETRKVFSYVKMPGVLFKLCFDRVGGEAVSGEDACYWANLRGPTDEEKPGVVERARLYPLGDGGPGMQYTLAVRLDDEEGEVLRYRAEDGGEADFSLDRATPAFDSYAEMFDHVTALLLPDGTRIEAAKK